MMRLLSLPRRLAPLMILVALASLPMAREHARRARLREEAEELSRALADLKAHPHRYPQCRFGPILHANPAR